MRNTQLILIEGLPGSGKSTLAATLQRVLAGSDIAVHWWFEGQRGHPLYVGREGGDGSVSEREVLEAVLSGERERALRAFALRVERLRTLTETLTRTGDIALFDGTFFGLLPWKLFAADLPNEVTMERITEAERVVRLLAPSIVQLRPPDVATALQRITARRGPSWTQSFIRRTERTPYCRHRDVSGYEGLLQFYADFRQLEDALYESSTLTKCRILVDADRWDSSLHQISAFLGLSVARASADPPRTVLSHYEGSYSFTRQGQTLRCRVVLEGGSLFLDDLPDVWQHTRLVPLGGTTFGAESFPYEFTFVENKSGRVREMHASGPEAVWGRLPSTFVRDHLPDRDSSGSSAEQSFC